MAELLTLLRLLAPGLVFGVLDRSRGRAVGRSSVLAGLGAASPACADLVHWIFAGTVPVAREGLLAQSWAAEAIAAVLALTMPAVVRFAWDVRGRTRIAALTRERVRLVAEWGAGT